MLYIMTTCIHHVDCAALVLTTSGVGHVQLMYHLREGCTGRMSLKEDLFIGPDTGLVGELTLSLDPCMVNL